jgi:hypothetical protein
VNLLGAAELTRQVVPAMQRQRAGHILNMASYASRIPVPPLTVYASTKAALESLSDGLRRELRPWGIYVSRVHPSGVGGTEFNQQAGRKGGIRFRALPIGRVSKKRVADTLVRLVQRPRREVWLGRLYDVAVFGNRRLPGLVDAFMNFWVRRKRREALAAAPALPPAEVQHDFLPEPRRSAGRVLLPAVLAVGATVLLAGLKAMLLDGGAPRRPRLSSAPPELRPRPQPEPVQPV